MATGKIETVRYSDFSKGMATAPSTIGDRYFPYMLNMLPVGDRLRSRFGWVEAGTFADGAVIAMMCVNASGIFTIATGGQVRWYAFGSSPLSISANNLVGTLPTGSLGTSSVSMCMFGSTLVVTSIFDGTYTGTTAAGSLALANATVKGNCVAVWQNKVWAGGGTRVWWSNAGSATAWTTASDFVDIKDISGASLTALGSGTGVDIIGRQSLHVFKDASWYRIVDSTTGEYLTMSDDHGATSYQSVAPIGNTVYFTNAKGLHSATGSESSKRVLRGEDVPWYTAPYLGVTGEQLMLFGSGTGLQSVYWIFEPRSGGMFPQQAAIGTFIPGTGATALVNGLFGTTNGLLLVNSVPAANDTLLVAPPPATGVTNITGQTIQDFTNTDFTRALRLPAISAQGRKTRLRRLFLTCRIGHSGSLTTSWQVYANIDAAYSGDSSIRSFPVTITPTDDLTHTWSQASAGAYREVLPGIVTSGRPTTIQQQYDFMVTSPVQQIPGFEISEIGLDTVPLGF